MSKYALVTGASGGIGKSIALGLAKRGYNLLLVSRSSAELAALAEALKKNHGVTAIYYAADLADTDAVNKVVRWVNDLDYPLMVLVNNAGFGLWGQFTELPLSDHLQMLRLNIDAVVSLSHQLLPLLAKQKQAYLLNVASTAAYQAVPTLALYSASKAAILSFTRALRYELRKGPVSVSCLSPGPTATGFAHRAGMDKLADLADKFNMSADDVADAALKGLFAKKAEIIPGAMNKLTAFAVRLVSKNFVERVGASLYGK